MAFTFGPKLGYEAWKEQQEKLKKFQETRKNKGGSEPSVSELKPIQYVDKNYRGSSSEGNYKWESDLLKSLPTKQYGRSYNDKFNSAVKELGISPSEASMFRTWLDSREDKIKTHKQLTDDITSASIQRQNQKPKETKPSLKNDILSPVKHWWDGVKYTIDGDKNTHFSDAFEEAVDDALSTDRSKPVKAIKPFTDEVGRAGAKFANGISLDLLKNISKKENLTRADEMVFNERKGAGKGADFAYDALGYLAPGVGALKGVKAAGLGVKEGAKGFAKFRQLAQEGALTGAGLTGAEIGIREGLNGKDYSAKDNLGYLALGTGLGALGDPLVHGAGQALKGASNQAVKKMLPNTDELAKRLSDALMTGNKSDLPTSKPIYGSLSDRLKALNPERKLLDFSNAKPFSEPTERPDFQQIFKKPNGLESPIPKMPKVLRNAVNKEIVKNDPFLKFGEQVKGTLKGRLPADITVPKLKDPITEKPQSYWQKRYEDFADYVHQNYDPNRITHEGLDELWTHFAKHDEPVNLTQLVDLAYPKGFEMPKQVKEPIPEKNLKDLLHDDPRIKEQLKAFYPDEPSLDTLIKRLKATAENMPKPKELNTNDVWDKFGNRKPVSKNALGKMGLSRLKDPALPQSKQPNFESIKKMPNPSEKEPGFEKLMPAISPTNKEVAPGLEALKKVGDNPFDNMKALQEVKDISQFQVGTKNIYQLAERLPGEQRERIISSLDTAKKNYVDHQEKLTNDLYANVVKKLGIKKGSKESALVQDYGEKTLAKKYLKKRGIDYKSLSPEELNDINLQQLKKVHPDKWEKIVAADDYFRKNYDTLIDQVNSVRAQLYPNTPEKLVPKRNDYYHHFKELEGFEGVKNLFETPSNIDPHLEGKSPFTKPNAKFQGFMQKRLNGDYKSDAVGGFLKYLQAATHSINVDPVIPVIRNTANEIADATTDTRNANNIIEALEDHAKDLAGKTNPYDRLLQKILGRGPMYRGLNALNSRVKSNMIVGNLSSALGQIGNVPLGIGKAKQYAAPGLADTLIQTAKQVLGKSKQATGPISKSDFLKERYSDSFYKRFDQKLIQQPKKLALWMMETSDKAGTNFIWNSMYRKGVAQKVKDPIKYADNETRHIVAGRGVGEVPLLQKAKTTQILAPFTLEVGNQWTVLKKMVGEKDATGIMTFLIASYGLNKAMEHIRGSGVTLDPVGAVQEGYEKGEGDVSDKLLHAAASLAGEAVGNIPGGNLLTSQVNTEKKIPYFDVKYKDLFGERDPNRFGSGLTVSKAASDYLYAILPFGASQFRKTTQGADAIKSKGVYKGYNDFNPFPGPKKQLNYPIDPNPLKNVQTALMGPNATSDAKEYYDNKRVPLTEFQTKAFKRMEKVGLGKDLYDILRVNDTKPYDKGKITKVEKDPDLSPEEKRAKLEELIRLLRLQKK